MPRRNDIKKIMIIGSGPIVIGQACEFDYSGTQACKGLRELGYQVVLVNSNPATIMTDPAIADATYVEPLNLARMTEIIVRERPDALLPNLGGQTALNLACELHKAGVLKENNVQVIGVQVDAIERGEDRMAFKDVMSRLGIEMPRSSVAFNVEEAERIAADLGYPVVIRPAYTMGGTGGGLVYNVEELRATTSRGLAASLVRQVLVEESVLGWEELEVEVVRDVKNRMIAACFIENVDAMGVHTGDSFCVAPMLTIAPELQDKLREYAFRVVEAVQVIGGSNIQFAHDPKTGRVVIVEMNPRTSRSSALASKATGLPIALVSAKLAVGVTLDELPYWRDQTLDKYTPSGDYVVVKFARWAFEKFKGAQDRLGTQMRAVGEVMSIGKTFKEAFQKAIRSLEIGRHGLGFARDFNLRTLPELMDMLKEPTSERQFQMYEALRKGASVENLYARTYIKTWFIQQMKELVELEERILKTRGSVLPDDLLREAKRDGFSDRYLARLLHCQERELRESRERMGIVQGCEAVPVSGVKDAAYYFSSYNSSGTHAPGKGARKIMVLGGGPNRIGQGIEFDYCCVHAAFALRDMGCETIMVNCNPETVSTDYDTSDKLYFDPLTVEDVLNLYQKERPDGVIVQFGGQTPLMIAAELAAAGVRILGTTPDIIDLAEDRDRFRRMMERLGIPMAASGMAATVEDALACAKKIGYPLMVRPSYVLGGRGMEVVYDNDDLTHYMRAAVDVTPDRPILVDKFLENAIEAEADAISDGEETLVPAIMEHIELAGIHSGDSACVIPPYSISEAHRRTIESYTHRIARELKVVGLMNMQYAIAGNKVYVLEANPRASRTVPLVSKICNLSMARVATRIMMGAKIKELKLATRAIPYYGVKEAVFPFSMLQEVDPVLGPEMRSTGEVLGLASKFGMAYYKSQEAAGQVLPDKGTVLITVAPRDRPGIAKAAKEYAQLGFRILATEGTQSFLAGKGIPAERIFKLNEGRPNIADAIVNGSIQLIVNTPKGKQGQQDDSYIRKAAIKHKIPYVTTLAAALASAHGIAAFRSRQGGEARSLKDYHQDISA